MISIENGDKFCASLSKLSDNQKPVLVEEFKENTEPKICPKASKAGVFRLRASTKKVCDKIFIDSKQQQHSLTYEARAQKRICI